MSSPRSWKDFMSPTSDMNKDGHMWVKVRTEGGTLRSVRYSESFGGSFGRVSCGGDLIKEPKIDYYQCNKCNITGTINHDMGGRLILDDKNNAGLNCEEVMIKDIII